MQETHITRRYKRDYGLELGKALTRPCTSRNKRSAEAKALDEERATLLPRKHKEAVPVVRPSWSQVFTPQSCLILTSYTLMSGLGMAFDAVFPVFLNYPVQDLDNNPDVQLPFKFAGGFGVGE